MNKVSSMAIGSLLPDSNSSSGCSFPFRLTLRERSMENTAAASVEDMIEPRSRHHERESCLSGNTHPARTHAKHPVNNAVSNTPALDKIPPVAKTDFTDLMLVSKPPENRMNAIATEPI